MRRLGNEKNSRKEKEVIVGNREDWRTWKNPGSHPKGGELWESNRNKGVSYFIILKKIWDHSPNRVRTVHFIGILHAYYNILV